jgi:hypothetical protein
MIFGHWKTRHFELLACAGAVSVFAINACGGAFRQRIIEMEGRANANEGEEKSGGEDQLFHVLRLPNCATKYVYLHKVFRKQNKDIAGDPQSGDTLKVTPPKGRT